MTKRMVPRDGMGPCRSGQSTFHNTSLVFVALRYQSASLLMPVNLSRGGPDEDGAKSTQEIRMALDWKDSHMVGDCTMDAEHQEWFQLANQFLMAGERQSMHASGKAFSQYTRHHFVNEEALMHKTQFPYTATHIKEHERLVSNLDKILDVVGMDVLSQTELEDFVGLSLVKHIANYDRPFAVYVRRSGAGSLV